MCFFILISSLFLLPSHVKSDLLDRKGRFFLSPYPRLCRTILNPDWGLRRHLATSLTASSRRACFLGRHVNLLRAIVMTSCLLQHAHRAPFSAPEPRRRIGTASPRRHLGQMKKNRHILIYDPYDLSPDSNNMVGCNLNDSESLQFSHVSRRGLPSVPSR
jgi:hypothetical protein